MEMRKCGNELHFVNEQENDEFANAIVNFLLSCESTEVKQYIVGPSEDVYYCTINNHELMFVHDLNYGCWFRAENGTALDLIMEFFKQASE